MFNWVSILMFGCSFDFFIQNSPELGFKFDVFAFEPPFVLPLAVCLVTLMANPCSGCL